MKFKRVIVLLMLFSTLLATLAMIPMAVGIVPPPESRFDPRADVNGDGVVDIFDLVIVAIAFGSRPGDPNWDPRADINEDGIVDIFDLLIVATNMFPIYPFNNPFFSIYYISRI